MDSEKELEESTLSSVNLRMEASSPSYGSEGETRNHRDAAEHISSIEKENFNLKLRIYHMEEHLNSNGGQDFQSILQQKVENEELKNELDENQKLLLAANQGISCLKRELEDEKKLRGKTENELSLLQTELRKTSEEKQRMKKQIERLREDARRSREKAAHSYESTEMQLNDSLNENRELQDKLEDLENNNMSLVDELSAKEGELSRVHDENDDLVDEVERLRAENVRLASQASRVPRKPRSYDMGIQCEGRMCEKASQTRNLDYAPRSRLPRPDNTRHMQRTTSVGNLSDRTSSPVRSYGSSRDLRIPVSTPHRYSESSSRYRNAPVHHQSTPYGLERTESERHEYSWGAGAQRDGRSSRNVHFESPARGKSMMDLHLIEKDINDIGSNLRDIKYLSESIREQNPRNRTTEEHVAL